LKRNSKNKLTSEHKKLNLYFVFTVKTIILRKKNSLKIKYRNEFRLKIRNEEKAMLLLFSESYMKKFFLLLICNAQDSSLIQNESSSVENLASFSPSVEVE
jgi:hypothetical protein